MESEHKASSQRHDAKILELQGKLANSQRAAEEFRREAERLQADLDTEKAQKEAIGEELAEARREAESERVFRHEAERLTACCWSTSHRPTSSACEGRSTRCQAFVVML
jgi:predicted RNase H-like nuclease (RuvC/YqgF family)